MLMVSRMSIYRRRVQFDILNDSGTSTQLTDVQLTGVVEEIVRQHPMAGQTLVWGIVRS